MNIRMCSAANGLLLVALLLPQAAFAQGTAFEIAFTTGAGLYDAGPTGSPVNGSGGGALLAGVGSCDETGAFLTNYNIQAGYGPVAVDFTFNHTDWPWDWWPFGAGGAGAPTDFLQRHGNSFEGVVLFRPAEAFDLGFTHRSGYTFQPLLGAGVQFTTDADDSSPSGGLPVYLAQSQTNLLLAYGFTLDLHPGSLSERGVGFRVQLLGKRGLRSSADFQTPSGVVSLDTGDSNWATLSAGIVIRPGGFRGQG